MICTFECTFCAECVENILFNVCPNCDGGFTPRPVRPKKQLAKNPASSKVIHFPVDVDKHADAIKKFKSIPPEER